jgi:hypothetical protein
VVSLLSAEALPYLIDETIRCKIKLIEYLLRLIGEGS